MALCRQIGRKADKQIEYIHIYKTFYISLQREGFLLEALVFGYIHKYLGDILTCPLGKAKEVGSP